ncbi:MAG: TRAP transporter large permease subunit [Pseudomonadota bacterium]
MNSAGVWMLLALAVLIVTTGLPVWALLIGVASAAAAVGLAAGAFGAGLLSSLPLRLTGLLDGDLLQALPLYVYVGVLLQRLPLAQALYDSLRHWLRRSGAADALGALLLGTAVAPMNGSVASSSTLLSRMAGARLSALGPARAIALLSAAATIGIVVPPSLVLILLGDTLMRAHTEASQLDRTLVVTRIINTQDVFHAALPAAAAVLLLWLLVAAWQMRSTRTAPGEPLGATASEPAPATLRGQLMAAATLAGIAALLGGVFTGRLLAVEAAATGGCVLTLGTLLTRTLGRAAWRAVLADTLELSGALLAVLVGATTFSLVVRAFGTDRWLADLALQSTLDAGLLAALLLALVAACAWVLDAFELIFVLIPIVAPVLILKLGDAQQAAVLLLLVLQIGFLLPPMGYALMLVRARAPGPRPGGAVLARALAPYLAAPALVLLAVLQWPALVHALDAPGAASPPPALSEQDAERLMREMGAVPEPSEPQTAR